MSHMRQAAKDFQVAITHSAAKHCHTFYFNVGLSHKPGSASQAILRAFHLFNSLIRVQQSSSFYWPFFSCTSVTHFHPVSVLHVTVTTPLSGVICHLYERYELLILPTWVVNLTTSPFHRYVCSPQNKCLLT